MTFGNSVGYLLRGCQIDWPARDTRYSFLYLNKKLNFYFGDFGADLLFWCRSTHFNNEDL